MEHPALLLSVPGVCDERDTDCDPGETQGEGPTGRCPGGHGVLSVFPGSQGSGGSLLG